MKRARVVLVSALLVAAGCRAETPPAEQNAEVRPTALAETPVALPSNGDATQVASPGGASTNDADPRGSAAGSPRPSAFRTIGSADDAAGDAGTQAPGYADLRAVAIADDGHSARITVRLDAAVPERMPDGEQMAIGVDLYERDTSESDYQAYAQATEDGWLAYLSTPEGLVEYPGRFAMGHDRLVFTIPWSSLDDIRGTRFSAYVDWDKEQPVLNQVGADRVPNRGTARFARGG